MPGMPRSWSASHPHICSHCHVDMVALPAYSTPSDLNQCPPLHSILSILNGESRFSITPSYNYILPLYYLLCIIVADYTWSHEALSQLIYSFHHSWRACLYLRLFKVSNPSCSNDSSLVTDNQSSIEHRIHSIPVKFYLIHVKWKSASLQPSVLR